MVKQLGLHAYFNPRWFGIMQKKFEQMMPRYLGHISLVPEANTYSLSPFDDGEHLITRDENEKIRIFHNICRHQGARLVSRDIGEPSGKCPLGNLTCTLHQWTWGLDGTLQGAPKFGPSCLTPARSKLKEIPCAVWHGMIFALPKDRKEGEVPWSGDIPKDGPFAENQFDLSGLIAEPVTRINDSNTSGIIFMNVFNDVRHVDIGHKQTLGSILDANALEWNFGKLHSIQRVPFRATPKKASPGYARWHELTLRILSRIEKETTREIFRGVLWASLYPWLTIEVFPLATVVSIIIPLGPSQHRNIVQFFYRPELAKLSDELFAEYTRVQLEAYTASMAEDDAYVTVLGQGLFDMHERGEGFIGLAHPKEEKGILAYHEFLEPIEYVFSKTSS